MQFIYQLPCFVLDISIISVLPGDKISSLSALLVSFSTSVKILEFKIGHNDVVLYTIYFVDHIYSYIWR
jgi:hypothetical protein